MSGPASFQPGSGSCGPFHVGVSGSPDPFPPHPQPGSHLPYSGLGPTGLQEVREAVPTHHFWEAPGVCLAVRGLHVLMTVGAEACFWEDPGVEGWLCVPRFLFGGPMLPERRLFEDEIFSFFI